MVPLDTSAQDEVAKHPWVLKPEKLETEGKARGGETRVSGRIETHLILSLFIILFSFYSQFNLILISHLIQIQRPQFLWPNPEPLLLF